MQYKYNKSLVPSAQDLRKNMTPEENRLWYDFLKKLPLNVNRQKIIGNYIVDFFISERKIVIELDGIQHELECNFLKDKIRDQYFSDLGITVLRYSNVQINNEFKAVCIDILNHLSLSFLENVTIIKRTKKPTAMG